MSKLLFIFVFFACNLQTSAQKKPVPTTLTPPQLNSYWSTTKGGSLPLESILNIVDSAVWVIDVKKNRYNISRFIILYKSKDRYEDEQSGEIKTRFNTNSVQIRNSPVLTEQWRKYLYENIKTGDELIITDLIVIDKQGTFFRAPDVKLIIN